MKIEVWRSEYKEIEALRERYRQEANCQIVHDSILRRELADPYLILSDGRVAGYGGVWNKYDLGRVMEFYTPPCHRAHAQDLFRELLTVSKATQIEAQTNMPLMLTMLYDFAESIATESILFEDAFQTNLPCLNGVFRHTRPGDGDSYADWGIEVEGKIVAEGGFLCHYNPPYGDVSMSVSEDARRQGLGSYLVQELKRVCGEAGKRPSARSASHIV